MIYLMKQGNTCNVYFVHFTNRMHHNLITDVHVEVEDQIDI